MKNRAVPAPIFNARKRPRQAMIADPQSSSGQPGPAGAAQYQGLMPPGGFNGGFQQHQQQYGSMSDRGDNNRSRPRGRGNYQTGPGRQSTGQQMASNQSQGTRNQNMTHQAGYQSNYQYNQGPVNMMPYQTGNPSHQTSQYQPNAKYSTSRSYSFSSKRNTGQPHHHTQQQATTSTQSKYGGPTMYGQGPSGNTSKYNNGGGRGYTSQQSNWQTQASLQYKPQPTATVTSAAFDDSFEETMNAIPSEVLNKTTQPAQPTVKNLPKKDVGETQRLVTVRVAGVRRWAKHSSNISLLYEVYGQLDSAIGRHTTDCKEFLLKDDVKDTIKCVFFEIDRQLIKMTRGQHYRVVGSYDQRQDRLKCISVRAVTDAERPLVQSLLDKSSQELAKLARQAREQ